MKKFLVTVVATFLVMSTTSVMAQGYKHKYRGHQGQYKHHNNYKHGGHHYKQGGHRYKHRSGHNSDNGAYLAGGLILGSILTHSYNNSHYSRPSYHTSYRTTYSEPVVKRRVIYSTRVIEPPSEPINKGRQFYKDLAGNCFEIFHSTQGDELKKELPQEDCHW